MKIEQLKRDNIDEFLRFYADAYPARNNAAERFEKQILDNPYVKDNDPLPVLLARDDDGQICGQFILNPAAYLENGKKKPCWLGCDLIVPEEQRASNAGALLAARGMTGFKPYFAIGVSGTALQLSRALKINQVAGLNKYMWVRYPWHWLKLALAKRLKRQQKAQAITTDWPVTLRAGESTFECNSDFALTREIAPPDDALLFERSPAFLKYRFAAYGDRFAMYESSGDTEPAYMIVRAVKWQGLKCLVLVDYRCGTDKGCASVFDACKKLALQLGLNGVIIMTSLEKHDALLRDSGFRRAKRATIILSSLGNPAPVWATMADSDVELNF